MKVTVTEQSASARMMEVVIDAKRVESAFQKAFKKNLKQFALPGFRKGKVPVAMASRYITDAGLTRDVIEDLVPKAFQEAVKEQELQPISQPDWDLVQNERGKDLIFKASFQVSPILEISGYQGLEITQERENITDEHIQETLDKMLEQHAYFAVTEEDRGIREGDFATVDYTSFQDGEEIENGSVSNYVMELKPENYIDGFVKNLLGAKAGEEREFEITFPDEYENEDLAGEKVTFKFKVHDIKEKKFPELDDEFAANHSAADTLDELKDTIRTRLEAGIHREAEGQAVTQLVQALLEQVSEDAIPPQLRQHHAQKAVRSRMYEMAQRGIALEQLLQARGMSQEDWLKEMMAAGLFEARLEVLYQSIARAEGIKVTSAEIDKVIMAEAPAQKMKPKKLKQQMEKNGSLEMLEYSLLTEKVQKFLLEKAEVTYLAPGEEPETKSKSKPKVQAKSEDKDKSEDKEGKSEKSDSKKAKESETKTEEKSKSETKKSGKAKSKAAKKSKDKAKPKAKGKKKSS